MLTWHADVSQVLPELAASVRSSTALNRLYDVSGNRVAPGADFTKVGSLRQRQALKAALVELRGARAEAARLEAERAKPKKCYTMSCNDYAEDLGEGRKLWQANDRLTGAINENAAPFSF